MATAHQAHAGAPGTSELSLLDVVQLCHNAEPALDPGLHPFIVDGVRLGYIIPAVFARIQEHIATAGAASSSSPPALATVPAGSSTALPSPPALDAVTFAPSCPTPAARSAALQALAQEWREKNYFPYPLDGWRNELYAIWAPAHLEAFRLERAACALFGVATFGVHLTAYVPDGRVWVPRRSASKATWPSYLDNTVAGGITAGDLPEESVVRECWEEAGFPEDLVRKHLKATGVITYVYKTSNGLIQPEIEYTYDLALPSADIAPNPVDGEAEAFELMSFEQVIKAMKDARFKPNCALVLIDFYIRHGLITPENEPDYVEIVAKMHNSLGLPMP